jgi:homopolymeric O-antigen transport system ATP-binding protein
MSEVVIRASNISKRYRLGEVRPGTRTLRDSLGELLRRPFGGPKHARPNSLIGQTIWALQGVSFEVRAGEVMGIVGPNGAGKSTLLKVLSRITEPTDGYAEIDGRVGSLLEVGTGFHPELTGRENVYLNGTILGMRRSEINRQFDTIVDFSGVEKFIDTPVKFYSSGMRVRLAFAVAAHLDPEILFVDEVLAVGDTAFQEKCLNKMSEVAGGGRTVLFVSHNLTAVATLCPRSIYLENGRVILDGETQAVIERYLLAGRPDLDQTLTEREDRKGNGKLRFVAASLQDADGNRVGAIRSGQGVRFVLDYEAQPDALLDEEVEIKIKVEAPQRERLTYFSTRVGGAVWRHMPRRGRLICFVPEMPLAPGRYVYHANCERASEMYDDVFQVGSFEVIWDDFFGTGRVSKPLWGKVLVRHDWQIEEWDNGHSERGFVPLPQSVELG